MAPVKALVFDLDDTLYPELAYVRSAFRAVAAWLEEAAALPADPARRWLASAFAQGDRGRVFDRLLAAFPQVAARVSVPDLVRVYRAHTPAIALYPRMAELLDEARARSMPVAVISDGHLEAQRRKARALGLARWADPVLFTDAWGAQAWKPDPRVFAWLQEALGRDPGRMVYVGDNPAKDFQAPRQLGWDSVQLVMPGQCAAGRPVCPARTRVAGNRGPGRPPVPGPCGVMPPPPMVSAPEPQGLMRHSWQGSPAFGSPWEISSHAQFPHPCAPEGRPDEAGRAPDVLRPAAPGGHAAPEGPVRGGRSAGGAFRNLQGSHGPQGARRNGAPGEAAQGCRSQGRNPRVRLPGHAGKLHAGAPGRRPEKSEGEHHRHACGQRVHGAQDADGACRQARARPAPGGHLPGHAAARSRVPPGVPGSDQGHRQGGPGSPREGGAGCRPYGRPSPGAGTGSPGPGTGPGDRSQELRGEPLPRPGRAGAPAALEPVAEQHWHPAPGDSPGPGLRPAARAGTAPGAHPRRHVRAHPEPDDPHRAGAANPHRPAGRRGAGAALGPGAQARGQTPGNHHGAPLRARNRHPLRPAREGRPGWQAGARQAGGGGRKEESQGGRGPANRAGVPGARGPGPGTGAGGAGPGGAPGAPR